MSFLGGDGWSPRGLAAARFLVLAIAVAWTVSATRAAAQSSPDSVIFHAGRVVPANGGVLVLVPTTGLLGAGAKAVPATIEVMDAGKTVAGQVREIGWIENVEAQSLDTTAIVGVGLVWTPIATLRPGTTYDVQVEVNASKLNHASFKAGPAWDAAQPEITLDAQLETRDTGHQDEHCCSTFTDGTGHENCFVSRYAQLPAVAPKLGTSDPMEQLEQFVYLYRAFSEDDSTLWETGFRTFDSPVAQVPFFNPRDQYCVEVQAMHLVDQRVFHWSRCLPGSELQPALPDPTQGIADGLRIERCSVPQYGDLLQWCEINREPCADGLDPDCAEYDALCSVSLPEALDVILAVQEARRNAREQSATDAGTSTGSALPRAATAAAPHALRNPRGGGCNALPFLDGARALPRAIVACALLIFRVRRRRR